MTTPHCSTCTCDPSAAADAERRTEAAVQRYLKVVKRASRMGLCSQTHHEHLMIEARRLLAGESND